MSYYEAKKLFNENLEVYASKMPDSLDSHALYNLSKGLVELAEAIESDLGELKLRLRRLE